MLDGFPEKADAMTFPIREVMRIIQTNWIPLSMSWMIFILAVD